MGKHLILTHIDRGVAELAAPGGHKNCIKNKKLIKYLQHEILHLSRVNSGGSPSHIPRVCTTCWAVRRNYLFSHIDA